MLKQRTSQSFFIKVREKGKKAWFFLADGGTTRLRIHACRFTSSEHAQELIDKNASENPEWEWKVVGA